MCRRLRCCCRVTVKSKRNYMHRFGVRSFYQGFGCFPIPISDTLGVLARTKCLRCASRRSGTSQLLFAVHQSRLCGLERLNRSVSGLVRAVLHSCAKIFASRTFVGRSSLTVHAKLAHQRICRRLVRLTGLRVIDCVPHGGAPCVVCAQREIRVHRLRVPSAICRRHGRQCRGHVDTVLSCIGDSAIYHDQVLLRCFKRGGRRGYKRYSAYVGLGGGGPSNRLSRGRLSRGVLRTLSSGRRAPTALTRRVPSSGGVLVSILRRLLSRNGMVTIGKVLRVGGWFVAFTIKGRYPTTREGVSCRPYPSFSFLVFGSLVFGRL